MWDINEEIKHHTLQLTPAIHKKCSLFVGPQAVTIIGCSVFWDAFLHIHLNFPSNPPSLLEFGATVFLHHPPSHFGFGNCWFQPILALLLVLFSQLWLTYKKTHHLDILSIDGA